MSETTSKVIATMTDLLPDCHCFSATDEFTLHRLCDVGEIVNGMCGTFHSLTTVKNICPAALQFVLETSLVTLLAYAARAEGPALEYGTEEIERESLRILTGMEARVATRIAASYKAARDAGVTAESVRAMREAYRSTRQ